jgi:uncharacterized protein YeaO (DUF488 family)
VLRAASEVLSIKDDRRSLALSARARSHFATAFALSESFLPFRDTCAADAKELRCITSLQRTQLGAIQSTFGRIWLWSAAFQAGPGWRPLSSSVNSSGGRRVYLRTKRIYDEPTRSDGRRILIDRLWPRGVSKEAAQIDFWAKTVAPSNELRQWYQHDPSKWVEFRDRYFNELDSNPDGVADLRSQLGAGSATLLFSSKEGHLNNASALLEYLESRA